MNPNKTRRWTRIFTVKELFGVNPGSLIALERASEYRVAPPQISDKFEYHPGDCLFLVKQTTDEITVLGIHAGLFLIDISTLDLLFSKFFWFLAEETLD